MDMKGLILSGGRGTRLRPITHTAAKQLVPVGNKPVLFYGIEALREAGITDIGIVVGDTHKEIRAAVGDGSALGVKVTYIHQKEPLGLAHAVKVSEDFLQDTPFVMYLGDNLILGGVKTFVEEFQAKQPDAEILLARVPNPQQFGVAVLEGDRVVNLEEKPAEPKSDLALVGVYLFTARVFDAVKAIQPSKRGELEITDAIQWLIDQGQNVLPHLVEGWWKDTGKLSDMLEANRMILDRQEADVQGQVDETSSVEHKVVVHESARVINSEIRGPAVIGPDAVIENSFIGPFTSIGPKSAVKNCQVENSILLEDVALSDIDGRISDSMFGKHTRLTRTGTPARVHRFMLGEHSEVDLV